MLKEPISITALSSISALGKHSNEVWSAYNNNDHFLTQKKIGEQSVWVSALANLVQQEIENLCNSDARYKHLDDTVLYAIYTGRKAIAAAGWTNESNFGVNIGSSRGATALFEKYHEEFLKNGKSATLSSPTTTLGNISSWVAHDLKSKGPEISHSITCSTALHSLLNGVAWIQSGMTDKFLVGGSEAPLTPFTIAQIQALKIYSRMSPRVESRNHEFPCRAFDLEKTENTMVLGEASASACLEKGQNPDALALIKGIGYATEPLTHNVSISADAQCFQDSMQMALGEMPPEEVDAVVMHSPGTIKGDASEVAAIKKICCNKIPFMTTNKWKVGHTFGASGMLSLEMAILMLTHQRPLPVPFVKYPILPKTIKNVLVNAVGFGGNAVSVLLSK